MASIRIGLLCLALVISGGGCTHARTFEMETAPPTTLPEAQVKAPRKGRNILIAVVATVAIGALLASALNNSSKKAVKQAAQASTPR